MSRPSISDLLVEYDRALNYTDELWKDLAEEQVVWRPNPNSSAIGWHLGHQAAVSHFMVRNLTAAEQSPDPGLDALMDSATAETDRGDLPDVARLDDYRSAVADRLKFRVGTIEAGEVGAPEQLRHIAQTMLSAIINHEYQHSKWIGEVRSEAHGKPLPELPQSPLLIELDGYLVVG